MLKLTAYVGRKLYVHIPGMDVAIIDFRSVGGDSREHVKIACDGPEGVVFDLGDKNNQPRAFNTRPREFNNSPCR